MRLKKSKEEMIEEDVKSIADALKVSVQELKDTKVSLYDIISVEQDKETMSVFNNARGVFKAVAFYIVKYLLKNNALVVKSVDTADSKSASERSASSILAEGTNKTE